eukprot:6027004-Ditylum_brightwellii.AAC.1
MHLYPGNPASFGGLNPKRGDNWKGVVKKFIGPLDRWATLNIAMNSAAKRTCQSDVMNSPPIQYTLANDMW